MREEVMMEMKANKAIKKEENRKRKAYNKTHSQKMKSKKAKLCRTNLLDGLSRKHCPQRADVFRRLRGKLATKQHHGDADSRPSKTGKKRNGSRRSLEFASSFGKSAGKRNDNQSSEEEDEDLEGSN